MRKLSNFAAVIILNTIMLLEKGRALFASGEFEKCEKLLRKQIPAQLEQPGITELYAYTLQKLGRFEEAMGHWNYLLSVDHMNPEYYSERGVCKFNLGFRSALEDIEKALELDPENPYRYASKAYILDKTGHTEEAYHMYLKAAGMDPEDEITQNNLSIVEMKLGYTREARQRFMEQEKRLGLTSIDTGGGFINEKDTSVRRSSSKVQTSRWKEVKSMVSSWAGFKSFLRDAGQILFGNK